MTKAKKVGYVQQPALATGTSAVRKPKVGILVATCFCLLILILITYAYAMTEQYVFNDSLNYSAINSVRDKSNYWLRLLVTGLSSPYSQQWLKATYAWDIGSFGFAPGWSHAVNMCLHIMSCLYFYIFTFRICWRLNIDGKTKIDPYYLAAAATALLACHPLTTGSIAYVSGRAGVLGAANYFLALNFFLYGFYEERLERAFGGYAFFFLFTAIGISSNMQCFTLPFTAFALTFILRPADVSMKEWLSERCYEMVILLVAGIGLCCLFTLGVPTQIDSSYGLLTLAPQVYWATQLKLILMYYLRCALVPFGLSVFPPFLATSTWSDPATIAGAVTITAIAVLSFIQKQPLIQIGAVLFLLNLLPWSVLVQGEIAADYRFYLSLSGLCLAAGAGIAYLAAKDFRKTILGFGILIMALVSLSIWRETEWTSNKSLWQAEIKRDSNNARAHSYLASDYLDANNIADAKTQMDAALKLDRDDFVAHLIKGFYYYKLKDYKSATPEFETAVKLGTKLKMSDDELSYYHSQLAKSYLKTGNIPAAYKEAAIAKQYITADPFLYLIVGMSQIEQHQPLIALKTLEDGLKLDPSNPDFLEPIAQAALDSGVPQVLQHAFVASERAVKVSHSPLANELYVRACLELGKLQEAHDRLNLMRKADPKNPEFIWLEYGYEKLAGNVKAADTLRKQALAADPGLEKRVRFFLRNKPLASQVAPNVVLDTMKSTSLSTAAQDLDPNKLRSAQPAKNTPATSPKKINPAELAPNLTPDIIPDAPESLPDRQKPSVPIDLQSKKSSPSK
jgi:tetratricopeptide (TPR) repeat protein